MELELIIAEQEIFKALIGRALGEQSADQYFLDQLEYLEEYLEWKGKDCCIKQVQLEKKFSFTPEDFQGMVQHILT